jgi:hypothetical protein
MVQPIITQPGTRETVPGLTKALSSIVSGLLKRDERTRQQDVINDLFAGIQQPQPSALPPTGAPATEGQPVQLPTAQPTVPRSTQRAALREKLFSGVMASNLPSPRKEQLLKAISLRFPEIEPQNITFRNRSKSYSKRGCC